MKSVFSITCYLLSFVSIAQLDAIEKKLDGMPPSEETIKWLCDTAYTFYSHDPLLTQKIGELTLERAFEWELNLGIARANNILGISYWARDMYENAIQHYLEALTYYDKEGYELGMALTNTNIGLVYHDLGESSQGKSYLLKSLATLRKLKDSTNLGHTTNNLGILYKTLSKNDSAFYYYDECMKIRMALSDSIGIAGIYNNIASLYLENLEESETKKDDALLAYKNLISAMRYVNAEESGRSTVTIKANIGKALTELNRYDEAKIYLSEALELAKKLDFKTRQLEIYDHFKNLYKRQGNYKLAFENYSQQMALNEEIKSTEISEQINKLNIQYETEKKERKLAEFEKQKAIDLGIRNMLLISVFSLVLLALILLFYTREKRKKDKLASELKLQKLKEQINSKNKEISSYTISFLQKNQLMEELKEQINELKKKGDMSTNKELGRIHKIVDNSFRSDDEWKNFQMTFEQMHDDFFKKLKESYPKISNSELKLCALIRLNMNLKECAKILGIAADSVKTARYRLRKKLGLSTDDSLMNFLIDFENKKMS